MLFVLFFFLFKKDSFMEAGCFQETKEVLEGYFLEEIH